MKTQLCNVQEHITSKDGNSHLTLLPPYDVINHEATQSMQKEHLFHKFLLP